MIRIRKNYQALPSDPLLKALPSLGNIANNLHDEITRREKGATEGQRALLAVYRAQVAKARERGDRQLLAKLRGMIGAVQ